MLRHRVLPLLFVLVTAAACTAGPPPAPVPSPPAPSRSVAPPEPVRPPSGDAADTVTAAGIGPYRIGVAQAGLKAGGLLHGVGTQDGCAVARGGTRWHQPALTFAGGDLQRVTVTGSDVSTPTGARVGTGYPEIQRMYPRGTELTDWVGAPGWFTVEGEQALLFRITDGKVASIEAGAAGPVQFGFTDRQPC